MIYSIRHWVVVSGGVLFVCLGLFWLKLHWLIHRALLICAVSYVCEEPAKISNILCGCETEMLSMWKSASECLYGDWTYDLSLSIQFWNGASHCNITFLEEEIVCVITHTLEIKSFSSEGQEERELKKESERETGWLFGQAVGVHFIHLWRASSLLTLKNVVQR